MTPLLVRLGLPQHPVTAGFYAPYFQHLHKFRGGLDLYLFDALLE